MGDFYKYKCKHCKNEQEFYTGGGFFTEEYYHEKEIFEKKLKEEILSGQYGELIKKLVASDCNDELSIFCDTRLFQCDNCRKLSVCREKRITNEYSDEYDDSYEIKISIFDNCPECHNGKLKNISLYEMVPCPVCAKTMELISFGKWD